MLEVKKLPANGGDIRDDVSLPRSERSPGERNNHSLQYSCLENPTDRGLHSIGLQRVGHDWSNLGWLQNNEETLICCGEACLVRAVPLQLYGCHKREHQLQSYTCPLLGVLAHNTERPILSLYCLRPNYPIMWKEVTSAPWASKAAGGLYLLCDQRGWHPEWRGLFSWRKRLREGSLCGVFAHHAHILPGVLSHLGLLHFSILWGAVRGHEQGAALAGELDCMWESSGCFKILIPWSHP